MGTASAQPAPDPRLSQPAAAQARRPIPLPGNFFEEEARWDRRFEELRQQLGRDALGGEGSGYGRYNEAKGRMKPKVYPHGNVLIPLNAMNRITREPHPAAASPRSATCSGWTELGPSTMPSGASVQRGVGRINWIDFNPANPNTVFAGSAKGGLFVSDDAGDSWASAGTDFLLPNIGAAHVAVDPTDGNRLLLATGDGDGLNDGMHDNGWNVSHGVYRSPDRGQNWEKIGLDLTAINPWYAQIKKLLITPNDSNVVYAATSLGLFSTANALATPATAVSWAAEPTGGNTWDPFYDVVYQPGSTSTIYASGITVVRSTDSGATWSPLPNIPFLGADVLRISMDVSPAAPDRLYALVVQKGAATCNGNANSSRLYRFDANTSAWTDKGPVCNTGSYGSDQRGVHSSRARSLGVSPTNPDLIFIGDVRGAKCTTGGDANFCNWTATAGTVHDDIHQMKFTPDGGTIYVATDGGVFKSVDAGVTWQPKNYGLSVATSLRMSTSATDPSLIMSGLFDDGTVLYQNGSWKHVRGGDGLTPVIDHTDPNHMFASSQGGGISRSDDMGSTFPTGVSLPSGQCSNWFTTYVLNPVNTTTVFAGCMPEVMRSTTRGGNWTPISQFAAQGMGNYQVWKLAAAPSNSNYLYAHLVGATPQLLMLSQNANAANPAFAGIGHPSTQWISGIDVDYANPNAFLLTYSGFAPSTEKVYRYDGNGNWQNLTGDLATSNLGVNSIVRERGSSRVFIGTHIGVYTADISLANPTWSRVGAAIAGQLPYVEVDNLEINYVNNKLRASTFGRGIWEIALDPCLPTVAGPDAIIRDSAADVGNQPNTDSGSVLWASPSIWVRNAADQRFTYDPIPPLYLNQFVHQNPEYSSFAANTPFIYAMVENRGNQPVSGEVKLYWANASTGLVWPGDWNPITPANPLTTKVTNLAPGGRWVVHTQWAGMPSPTLSVGGHFCLLARFVADGSTPDPIVAEAPGSIWDNVFNSNNIAWKNVTIVDNLQNLVVGGGKGAGQVYVRNISRERSAMRLDLALERGSESFLRAGGRIELDLGPRLFGLWKERGAQGKGIAQTGPTTLVMQDPQAFLDGLELSPREEHIVTVRVDLRQPLTTKQPEFILQLMQSDRPGKESKLRVTGGETFVIRPAAPPRR